MSEEERRTAPDGGYYTYQEFVDFYGGENEWHNAPEAIQQPNIENNEGWGKLSTDNVIVAPQLSTDNVPPPYDDDTANNDNDNEDEDNTDNSDNEDIHEDHQPTSTKPTEGYYDDDGTWIEPEPNANATTPEGYYDEEGNWIEPEAEEEDSEEEEEEEEPIDWFEELDEDDQDDLTEFLDDFLEQLECYIVLDQIIYDIENYNPELDPIHLDQQSLLGFRNIQSISYVEKFALGNFFKLANGNVWDRSRGWNTFDTSPYRSTDPVTWYGIRIDKTHRSVMGINLGSNLVSGQISADLGKLTRLTTLILNRNQLVGDIPEAVFSVPTLRSLDLHGNKLTGEIPDGISKLKMLNFLYLQHNQLEGRIDNLFKMPRLKKLDASYNEFSWSIPDTIRKARHLEKLVLSHNQLMGSIPSTIGKCNRLVDLKLDG